VITAPAQESRHWLKGAGAVLGVLLLPVRSRLSSRLEAGTSDHFVQFLGGLGHLVQLSGNRVEISGRRSTRAIQIIDVDHALDPIDGAISVNPDVVHQVRNIIAGAERRVLLAATVPWRPVAPTISSRHRLYRLHGRP
jgi:hypothetical protein